LSLYDTPPPAVYTLSLHDALPICLAERATHFAASLDNERATPSHGLPLIQVTKTFTISVTLKPIQEPAEAVGSAVLSLSFPESRSEEHTSELQSLRHLVCRLLLEK